MVRIIVGGLLAAVLATTANAAILFQDLGVNAPPPTLGAFTMLPFSPSSQGAIADGTAVTTVPGSPIGGTLTLDLPALKQTVPTTWNGWAHGYTGPVFSTPGQTTPSTRALTLPVGAKAFYFYANQNNFTTTQTITAISDTGTTSGPIVVQAQVNTANGYGFYATAGENIRTITITTSDVTGFGFGEFAIATLTLGAAPPIPAVADGTLVLLASLCLLIGVAALHKPSRPRRSR